MSNFRFLKFVAPIGLLLTLSSVAHAGSDGGYGLVGDNDLRQLIDSAKEDFESQVKKSQSARADALAGKMFRFRSQGRIREVHSAKNLVENLDYLKRLDAEYASLLAEGRKRGLNLGHTPASEGVVLAARKLSPARQSTVNALVSAEARLKRVLKDLDGEVQRPGRRGRGLITLGRTSRHEFIVPESPIIERALKKARVPIEKEKTKLSARLAKLVRTIANPNSKSRSTLALAAVTAGGYLLWNMTSGSEGSAESTQANTLSVSFGKSNIFQRTPQMPAAEAVTSSTSLAL
jgi:hypothetical protein